MLDDTLVALMEHDGVDLTELTMAFLSVDLKEQSMAGSKVDLME